MREWLVALTEPAIAIIDGLALVTIVYGTLEAFVSAVRFLFGPDSGRQRREIWLRYGRWLVAGLTFQLAADIIETSITTSWEALARLGAIALIRTFLNFFLERDIGDLRERQRAGNSEVVETKQPA
jgi:uncharacterized membrane protein